jgi:hypothetical protein
MDIELTAPRNLVKPTAVQLAIHNQPLNARELLQKLYKFFIIENIHNLRDDRVTIGQVILGPFLFHEVVVSPPGVVWLWELSLSYFQDTRPEEVIDYDMGERVPGLISFVQFVEVECIPLGSVDNVKELHVCFFLSQ